MKLKNKSEPHNPMAAWAKSICKGATWALLTQSCIQSGAAAALRGVATTSALDTLEAIGAGSASRTLLANATASALPMPSDTYQRQLVLSHPSGNLDWLQRVPPEWSVLIYGGDGETLPKGDEHRVYERRPLDFYGESHAIAHHLASNYQSLADYTAFAHEDPFVHSPRFVERLSDPGSLAEVQTLSLRRNEHLPTAGVLTLFGGDGNVRSERISLRTGASLYYHDRESSKGQQYRQHYQLHEGVNLVADYLTSVGLPGWVPETQDVGTYAHGSMFGVSRERVQQHPQSVYQMMEIKDEQSDVNGPVAEKSWLMLFGGAHFNDHPAPKQELRH